MCHRPPEAGHLTLDPDSPDVDRGQPVRREDLLDGARGQLPHPDPPAALFGVLGQPPGDPERERVPRSSPEPDPRSTWLRRRPTATEIPSPMSGTSGTARRERAHRPPTSTPPPDRIPFVCPSTPASTSSTRRPTVQIGNRPVPVIAPPSGGTSFSAGVLISVSGTASDVEDGTIPPASLSWTVVFQHDRPRPSGDERDGFLDLDTGERHRSRLLG